MHDALQVFGNTVCSHRTKVNHVSAKVATPTCGCRMRPLPRVRAVCPSTSGIGSVGPSEPTDGAVNAQADVGIGGAVQTTLLPFNVALLGLSPTFEAPSSRRKAL